MMWFDMVRVGTSFVVLASVSIPSRLMNRILVMDSRSSSEWCIFHNINRIVASGIRADVGPWVKHGSSVRMVLILPLLLMKSLMVFLSNDSISSIRSLLIFLVYLLFVSVSAQLYRQLNCRFKSKS